MKQYLHASVRKCCALTLIVLSANYSSFSQISESSSYWEIGMTMGPGNALTDVQGAQGKGQTFLKDNNFKQTKFMWGGYVGYSPKPYVNFRLAFNFGSLEADDAKIKSKGGMEDTRKNRNSNFRTKIKEMMLLAEIYPTTLIENDPEDTWLKLRPYVVAGIGVFKFNPQGQLNANTWVDLQPLHTEGQGFPQYADRKPYKLTQINLPVGAGVKYFLTENTHVSLEVLHRILRTDYLDDVSTEYINPADFTGNIPDNLVDIARAMANKSIGGIYKPGDKRGTKTNNDAYYTFNIKVGFRLGNGDRYGTSTRCPIRF